MISFAKAAVVSGFASAVILSVIRGSPFDVLSVVVLGYATYHVFFGNLR